LGYLVTTQGVGNLVGASLITRLRIRTSPQALVPGGLAILTAGSLGFVLSHGAAPAFVAYFLIGIGIGIKSTGDQTSIQMHVAPETLGRVWATISMVPMLVSLGVAPLAGWLGDRLPVRARRSTDEISTLVRNLQQGSAQAVQIMESGTREVEAGAALADDAGRALTDIGSGIGQMVEAADSVAAIT